MAGREVTGYQPLSIPDFKLEELSIHDSPPSSTPVINNKTIMQRHYDQKPDTVEMDEPGTGSGVSDRSPSLRSLSNRSSTTSTTLASQGPTHLRSSSSSSTAHSLSNGTLPSVHSATPPPSVNHAQRNATTCQPSILGPPLHNGHPGTAYRPAPAQGYYERPPGSPSIGPHMSVPPPQMNTGKYYYGPTNSPRPQYAPMGYQQQQPYGRPPPSSSQQQSQQQRVMTMTQPYSTPPPPPPPMMMDSSYLPESSVLAANQAGRKSPPNHFPLPSMENLQQFKTEAQASNDPGKMLDLAKYMMEVIPVVCAANTTDPKRARKIKDTLTMEAQRIVKKLASNSGLGKTGYAEAQFYLADCYGTGKLGLAVDADKAFSHYLQGSKQNHPACTYRVAVCYELGAGTKKDNAHAIQFFRKAANLGDGRAMYKLSMVLLRGTMGQPKNPREGMSWLERAATQADDNYPQPIHDLGVAFEKEGVPSVIPDLNYARDLFTRAAQYGYAPSQFKLGLAYENGFLNCPIDPRRSIAWYSKAAEQGDLESELALSGWYLTGATGPGNRDILPQNDVEAYLWARKAADRGYAKAEYAVGYYTETGVGVKQSLDEARKWYMRAAAQNNRRAMQRLSELKKHGNIQQRKKHTRDNGARSHEKDSDCTIM
ncbi:hypothetical protein BC941DRAFT_414721 [Chlamydoabsidia padenii]|nr:hypothetical protein BC941DRAFT_414721 [Chlamydoabsidia padenii]